MKIAIASSGDTIEAAADPRFGRCRAFLIVDTETGDVVKVDNPGALAGGGAGIEAAQTVANAGADAVIAGNYGPSAAQTLDAGGIPSFTHEGGTVGEVVEAFKAGALTQVSGPTVDAHFGIKGDG